MTVPAAGRSQQRDCSDDRWNDHHDGLGKESVAENTTTNDRPELVNGLLHSAVSGQCRLDVRRWRANDDLVEWWEDHGRAMTLHQTIGRQSRQHQGDRFPCGSYQLTEEAVALRTKRDSAVCAGENVGM